MRRRRQRGPAHSPCRRGDLVAHLGRRGPHAAVLWGAARLTIVIMPVAIALTVAVLLEPLVSWMRQRIPAVAGGCGRLAGLLCGHRALSQAAAELVQVPQLANSRLMLPR